MDRKRKSREIKSGYGIGLRISIALLFLSIFIFFINDSSILVLYFIIFTFISTVVFIRFIYKDYNLTNEEREKVTKENEKFDEMFKQMSEKEE